MIQVLIVDDDPMVAELNRQYVESVDGFSVIGYAKNGNEALIFCQQNKVHLIILDIYMPKLNGLDFLKILRKEFIMIDVLMVTASRETESVEVAYKLGAIDYLIKPFEFQRLKQSLDNYLKRIELLSASPTVHQKDLDKIMNTEKNISPLAKGLHKNTLELINSHLQNSPNSIHKSESISEKVGISKVTVRKYMEYLQSIGKVIIEVNYGDVGRPSYIYRYIKF